MGYKGWVTKSDFIPSLTKPFGYQHVQKIHKSIQCTVSAFPAMYPHKLNAGYAEAIKSRLSLKDEVVDQISGTPIVRQAESQDEEGNDFCSSDTLSLRRNFAMISDCVACHTQCPQRERN